MVYDVDPASPFLTLLQSTFDWLTNLGHIILDKFIFGTLANMPVTVSIWLIMASIFLLVTPPTFISKIISLPYKLLNISLRYFGLIEDTRTWGVVYDSRTKEPIDPAYVTVRGSLGKVAATAITDMDGRFGIIVPPGIYTLIVEKTNYVFPSTRLLGHKTDGYYSGLYFGTQFEVTEIERALSFAIPMDSMGADWNQSEKSRHHVSLNTRTDIRNAATLYFFIAGIFISLRHILYKDLLTLQLLEAYAVILVLGMLYVFFKPTAYYHSVVLRNNLPLSFAKIKVFKSGSNIQVASKSTSLNGQFTCLVPNGTYFVTIEERGKDGIYKLVHTSESFRVLDGSINRKFLVL